MSLVSVAVRATGAPGPFRRSTAVLCLRRSGLRLLWQCVPTTSDPRSDSCPTKGREPGLSFFDRKDQQNLFKLHLPYIWRTPAGLDSLFLPPLNRSAHGFGEACGLVETEWYANPVNLVLGKPPGSVHVAAGDPIAQVILIPRSLRRCTLEVAAPHSQLYNDALTALAQWDRQLAEDRSAYKVLARSRHGRIEGEV